VRAAPSDRLPAADFDADRYSADNLAFWGPLLVELGEIRAGHDVLDVGCATGGLSIAIAERARAHVVGCDLSPSFLGHARRKSADVEWVRGDAEALPFAASSFDRVLTSLLLHQVARPARALAEAFRVLRRGGKLVVRTVLPADAAARIPFRFFPTLAQLQAEQMPTLRDVTGWAEAAGFAKIRTRRVLRNKELRLTDVEAWLRREVRIRYAFLASDELEAGLRRMRESWSGDPDPRPNHIVVAEKND
jgi:SAM-dependent methyltransferase